MLTPLGNIHHHTLPRPGEIGRLRGLERSGVSPHRRCIVEAYPLCDNVWPWSHGIHTVTVRFLDNNERRRFSGFYFECEWAWEPRTHRHKGRAPEQTQCR